MNTVNTETLKQDMRAVIVDAEELLKATATQAGERVEKVRARTEQSLRTARERLQNAGDRAESSVRETVAEVNAEVQKHPWATAGVAAGVGLLVGLLIGRR